MTWFAPAALVACTASTGSPDSAPPPRSVTTPTATSGSTTDTDPTTEPTQPPQAIAPIVVVWSLDTTSATVAAAVDLCARVAATAAPYGLDVACRDGAIAPSTWTIESHLRFLYPMHQTAPGHGTVWPACDEKSSLAALAEALDGRYYAGVENNVFNVVQPPCDDDSNAWFHGAEQYWMGGVVPDTVDDVLSDPVGKAIDAMDDALTSEEAVVLWLNDFLVGGHVPRCYLEPSDPGCGPAWEKAVGYGLVQPGDDRQQAWLELFALMVPLLEKEAAAEGNYDELRELAWGTIVESANRQVDAHFLVRLDQLLAKVDAAGRMPDLTLVLVGDHGEAPCIEVPFEPELTQCAHAGLPSEWTGPVPFMVAPATLADAWHDDGLLGGPDQVWSLNALPWALYGTLGVTVPDDWPEPPSPGTAVSWFCRDGQREATGGVFSSDDDAMLLCGVEACVPFTNLVPEHPLHRPTPLAEVPAALVEYTLPTSDHPHRFGAICAGL